MWQVSLGLIRRPCPGTVPLSTFSCFYLPSRSTSSARRRPSASSFLTDTHLVSARFEPGAAESIRSKKRGSPWLIDISPSGLTDYDLRQRQLASYRKPCCDRWCLDRPPNSDRLHSPPDYHWHTDPNCVHCPCLVYCQPLALPVGARRATGSFFLAQTPLKKVGVGSVCVFKSLPSSHLPLHL